MKRIFLDTNVLIDFLGEREGFYEDAARIVSLADMELIELYASSLSYATTSYILSKCEAEETVRKKLRAFSTLCHIAGVGELAVNRALYSDFSDFEDALQYYSAAEISADAIVTRNKKDFTASAIAIYTAKEFINSHLYLS